MIRMVSKNAFLGAIRAAQDSAIGPGILPPPIEVSSFRLRTTDSMGCMSKDNGILACAKVLRTRRQRQQRCCRVVKSSAPRRVV